MSGDADAWSAVHGVDTVSDIRATTWCCGWRTPDPSNVLAIRRQVLVETVSQLLAALL